MDAYYGEQMDEPQQGGEEPQEEGYKPTQPEDSEEGEKEEKEYEDMEESDSQGEYGPLDQQLDCEEDKFPSEEEQIELVSYSEADFEHPGQEIGKGQTGTIYKMLYKPTGDYFAVKKIPIKTQEDKHVLLGELRTLANFSHECLVRCLGTYDAEAYLFVEVTNFLKLD